MKLDGKKFCVFGIQGSGKTFLAKHLLKFFNRPIVYEVNPDYNETNASCYKPKDYRLETLDNFCKQIKQLAITGKCDLFVIDEADMFLRGNFDLLPNLNDLVINHRHYGLSICLISRRPQDVPSRIVESSYAVFVFKLEGVNALDKFKKMHDKLPEMIERLEYEEHNFVVKELGKEPYISPAIRL